MNRRVFATTVSVILASVLLAAADESVSTARELYSAAAYEDALVLLNRLRASGRSAEEVKTIEQYRAFCLLALGRREDAEQAIAAVIAGEPSYHPSESEASPRVRSAFAEVRRRMLPALAEEKYAAAKGAFDHKDFAAAADGFTQVLDLLSDPDLGAAANQPPIGDLRMLAGSFRDLSVRAVAPPPLPAPMPPAPALPIVPPPTPPGPVRGRIYGAEDADVVPPMAIKQVIPPFQYPGPVPPGQGLLELVIGETGAVQAAAIRKPVSPKYDPQLVNAARSWRYKPATLNGIPVVYRKLVAITVKQQR